MNIIKHGINVNINILPWSTISYIFWTGRPANFNHAMRMEYDDPHHRYARWHQR